MSGFLHPKLPIIKHVMGKLSYVYCFNFFLNIMSSCWFNKLLDDKWLKIFIDSYSIEN